MNSTHLLIKPRRNKIIAILLLSFLLFTSFISHANKIKILYFDPDGNLQHLFKLKYYMQKFLGNNVHKKITFQSFIRYRDFYKNSKTKEAGFAIISSSFFYSKRYELGLRPLYIAQRNNRIFYNKILVVRKNFKLRNIYRSTIATTVSGANYKFFLNKVLFSNFGINAYRLRFLRVPRDVDAVFAIAFRQVDAAIVSPRNIKLIKKANPRIFKNLKILYYSKRIYFPLLVAFPRNLRNQLIINKITREFSRIKNDAYGARVMKILGFDSWSYAGGIR